MIELFGGCSEIKIDVPIGTTMGGYAGRSEPSKGEHDPLHIKTIILQAGRDVAHAISITSCDLVGLEKTQIERVKSHVSNQHGIPIENILIAATHTHSGPRNIALFGEPYADHKKIYELISESITNAFENLEPVVLYTNKTKIHDVTFNRRVYDPTSAPVDDECNILVVKKVQGDALAVLYNFACHPVVMGSDNLLITTDWVYYANETIRKGFPDCIPIFLQGATGNLNPINTPIVGEVPKHTFDNAAEIGVPIGKAIVHAAGNPSSLQLTQPMGIIKPVSIMADDEDKAEIFTFANGETSKEGFLVNTVVQAVRISNVAFVGIPGELFSEISLNIKKTMPENNIMVIGYANDYIGYIPMRDNYLAGGYETTMMSLCEEEGEIIQQAAIEALKEIYKE